MPLPDRLSGAIVALGLPPDHVLAASPAGRLTVADVTRTAPSPTLPLKRGGDVVALCLADSLTLLREVILRDGHCAAMLLLDAALSADEVERLVGEAGAGQIATERKDLAGMALAPRDRPADGATRWLLTTSGTTARPKIVAHDFASVSQGIRRGGSTAGARWGLVYEPSRFAALQVMLQALLGGGTLLLPAPEASLAERVAWLAGQGCTHLSATPAWWRLLLMTPGSKALPLEQITLGGEIADAACLSALRAAFPAARLTHVYASTETGVGFSVQDGKPGFPAAWVEDGTVEVRDGMLWITAEPRAAHVERDARGFVCTRDRVELAGDRVHFLGRDDAAINVGGVKVFAEQVEAVVLAHPAIAQCRVSARPSSLLGNVLALSFVARDPAADAAELRREIKLWCADRLARPARPATIEVAERIDLTPAGKIARRVEA